MYKIYKLISKLDANTVYIGSTKQPLQVRLNKHKSEAKRNGDINIKYKWISENCKHLEIIEISEVDGKDKALLSERAQVLLHIKGEYTVLNTCYTPTTINENIHSLLDNNPALKEISSNHNITYQAQYRKCGKASCNTCRNGLKHGPYWYAYWREGSKLKSAYVGKEYPS